MLPSHEGQETLVVFMAGWAALEVGPHARDLLVRLRIAEFEFDVAIELLEALPAGHLRSRWADEPCQ